jgi:hypothetical protein
MRTPDEVAAIVRLRALGWGTRRIAGALGCNRETVQRYLSAGGWTVYRAPERAEVLAGHLAWIAEQFRRHHGNADVVRQELATELGVVTSLRTVERAVLHLRREMAAALATVRFETPPGRQFSASAGLRWKAMSRARCVCSSRRSAIRGVSTPRPSSTSGNRRGWRVSTAPFVISNGVPGELLLDNAKALVQHHDAATREVVE